MSPELAHLIEQWKYTARGYRLSANDQAAQAEPNEVEVEKLRAKADQLDDCAAQVENLG